MRTVHSKELFKNFIIPKGYIAPILVAYHIKTPENLGNIIRLAGNTACKEVFFVTDSDNIRSSKIKRTASSAFKEVKWSFCTEVELKEKIPNDYKWIAVETSSDSKNIFQTKLPEKVALIVGSEIHGLEPPFLDKCHEVIHIPLIGKVTSMNVSHALAVALFEWQRQFFMK